MNDYSIINKFKYKIPKYTEHAQTNQLNTTCSYKYTKSTHKHVMNECAEEQTIVGSSERESKTARRGWKWSKADRKLSWWSILKMIGNVTLLETYRQRNQTQIRRKCFKNDANFVKKNLKTNGGKKRYRCEYLGAREQFLTNQLLHHARSSWRRGGAFNTWDSQPNSHALE